MINYKKWNTILGWCLFAVATIVYFITIEDSVSLWDCGEYITAAYKLEVGHPPGAPLFMVIGRLFSFFAEPTQVAVWINRLSALSSALTILFMFWSLTLLIKKIILNKKPALSSHDCLAIFVSASIGALAYTFTDSFWFSAVEGEVYAMASLFTAAIFWAILKWDEEMAALQNGKISINASPHRWLLLIMFLLGLAIGVHLLGILVIPAIGYFIYFRYTQNVNLKGIIITGILSVFILGFIQEGIIPGSIAMASAFEVSFVNSAGLPFYSGTIFFFALLIFICFYITRLAKRKNKTILYNSMMGIIMLLIGYGSFAVIVIRSNANTPLDENDPENLVTLKSYLKREQYGSAPIFSGPYWNSSPNDQELFDDQSPTNLRRFVVVDEDTELKAFKNEGAANSYAKNHDAEVVEKYYESNASVRENSVPTYSQTTFFPRMYSSQDKRKVEGYKKWSGYDSDDDVQTDLGSDENRLPTFGENLTYFYKYQIEWMYWRYFMWNFSGRQNDIQGHGDAMRGNWKTGFASIDNTRLGDQDKAPFYTTNNKSNNSFFLLPFILGLIGLIFHFYKAPKDAFALLLAFLFTGIMIVIYLNQKPFEPRERDYAYAGSFYFFAFWIGIGVYGLIDFFKHFDKKMAKKAGIITGSVLLFCLILDKNAPVGMPATLTWLYISVISIFLIGLMLLLKKIKAKEIHSIITAGALGLCVPVLMAFQGWDDHDRSEKSSAQDLSSNYLNSCTKNAILFTNGDNDTFPLWYLQEVEGKRTDVRVCNLSLMQTDWYTDQMKMKAYDSDPLPIKFREDQILMYAGNTDLVYFLDLLNLMSMGAKESVIKKIIALRINQNKGEILNAIKELDAAASPIINKIDIKANENLRRSKSKFFSNSQKLDQLLYDKFNFGLTLLRASGSEKDQQAFQKALTDFEEKWNTINLDDAMAFVRNDNNIISSEQTTQDLRIFPSNDFTLNVNAKNAIKSGVISAKQKDEVLDEINFSFDQQALSREQVMMLDILANNDWKRGVFFSSPGGSEVSMSLYKRGYIKQTGLTFMLSPTSNIKNPYPVDADKMYTNMMNKYSFGKMNKKEVLTDYYARRHTSQYRRQFSSLAAHYIQLAEQEENFLKSNPVQQYALALRQRQEIALAKEVEKDSDSKSRIARHRKKAINLLNKSLKIMPPSIVIDGGEPSTSGEKYTFQNETISGYQDGNLSGYVELFYKAKDYKAGEKLGLEILGQQKQMIDYFMNSNAYFAYSEENIPDLMASISALFKLYKAKESNPNKNSKLHKEVKSLLDKIYYKKLPNLYRKIDLLKVGNDEEEISNSLRLRIRLDAIATHNGFKEKIKPEQNNTKTP